MAVLCRKGFSKKTSFLLWMMAEIAIIGADIQVKYLFFIKIFF